ncbi:MAG TPA: metal-sensing transcriptional repressor [Candidatus Desulfovibrio gallistercoris]|uniref:metal-sensing transcriptional repressor n=1 Tax=uncultured Desulfovibrio sp. TaxID=167968 RepID=UPI001F91461B|nr:metal-sensing transcriptional repressor [uncultured Desulfovibrio sp.]HJA76112.1 metal-sensing transcriptional repressor [Candidatus Desulfovibrio gallistercoris]
MKQCMDAEKLHRRIGKLIGQLKAIDQMIDRDVPCEDVLMQINAVKGALHKVGQIILEGHLQHCVRDGIEHGDAEATIAAFAKAIEHFSRRS